MSPRMARWFRGVATAMFGAFLTLCVLAIVDSRIETLRNQQNIELSRLDFKSSAGEDLPKPAAPFRSDVRLTDTNVMLDDTSGRSAWRSSDSKLSAYLDRLKRMEAQKIKVEDKLLASTDRLKLPDAQ